MSDPSSDVRKRLMLVVVHDCSSSDRDDLSRIADGLEPIVGRRMSAAVIPRRDGRVESRLDARYLALLERFSEHLLHGWTHRADRAWSPIAIATGRADEFSGLRETSILERIERGREDFERLTGRLPLGFLPPAWQLPIRSERLVGLKFVMRFRRLESCEGTGDVPLSTFSWDWGRVGALGAAGECWGRLVRRLSPTAIPCVAIHPADVRRGWFSRALRLVERLAGEGYRPTTATELMIGRGPQP